jgi:monoterpene epsilon-lactone hydrolase
MTASPQADELRKQLTSLAKRAADNPDMGLDAMREMFDTLSRLQAEPTDVTYEETAVGDRPALWARPLNAVSGRAVLYIHGGGFISHDMNTSRKLVGHLAKAARATALIPDCRLAPEYPFPAALDDAMGSTSPSKSSPTSSMPSSGQPAAHPKPTRTSPASAPGFRPTWPADRDKRQT